MSNNCLFCKIVAGELGGAPVYQDEEITAFNDINPQAPVHFLVIPVKPMERIAEASKADRDLLGHLLLVAARLASDLNLEKGYRIIINNGRDGGESVPHLHVHVLGGRQMTWPPG